MACFGLKLGQDLGNRAAHPTENSEELSSGHFPYLNLGIFFYSVKNIDIYLFKNLSFFRITVEIRLDPRLDQH